MPVFFNGGCAGIFQVGENISFPLKDFPSAAIELL
jgi:hypothetical protein